MTIEFTRDIAAHLPYLRRYARAMTGSQEQGDALAEDALISLLDDGSAFSEDLDPKIVLFRQLHDRHSSGEATTGDLSGRAAIAQEHMARLTPGGRDALFLKAVEMFTDDEIAAIMRTRPKKVEDLVRVARLDIANAIAGQLLVIEDETSIAADLAGIVTGMGHTIVGSAPSASEAVEIAREREPDLILSDIRLNEGGSGIDAVSRIQADYPGKPVIFVTGFPEDLLTGRGPEPTFLIAKPYTVDQVRSAVSQAMFFAPRRRQEG